MGRKTIFKRLQIERELLWVKPALFHSRDERIIIVNPLCSAVYLKPSEQQIESAGVWGLGSVFVGIKSALCGGVSCNEYEIRALFFFSPFANRALVLRLHVGSFGNAECFLNFAQCENRYFIGYERRRGIE